MPPALLALALCTFSIGTAELVIVGLLPDVSAELGVTIPTAGLLVTGYALGVVFGGPVVTAATIRAPKKALLVALMAVFVAGNALAALAQGYAALMAGRVVSSLAHGAFFGVAIAVVAGLVPEGRRGAAIGLVVTGLTVSTMTGVPMGTLLGQRLGWEAAFLDGRGPGGGRGRGDRASGSTRRGRGAPGPARGARGDRAPAGAAVACDDGRGLRRCVHVVHLHSAATAGRGGLLALGGLGPALARGRGLGGRHAGWGQPRRQATPAGRSWAAPS